MDITLWHRRFGHLNFGDVHKLASRNLVSGLTLNSRAPPDPICEPCLAGKQHRLVNRNPASRETVPLALIHSDLHGPLPVSTPEGKRYWIIFIDDATRAWTVMLLRDKSEAFDAFKRYKAYVENATDRKIKCLRDDKGGEYMSKEFDSFLAASGIARQHTVRNEPHQNGVAERANRTLAEGVTAMLSESHLPSSFWGYAVHAYTHARNRSPTAALNGGIPYTSFFGKKPDVSHLRVFGCTAYVHVQKDQRKGLNPHTQKCVFIGYPSEYKGWEFYNPLTKKIIVSNSADFDERTFPGLTKSSDSPLPSFYVPSSSVPEVPIPARDVPEQVGDLHSDNGPAHSPGPDPDPQVPPSTEPSPPVDPPAPPSPPPRRYPLRERRPPKKWWESTRYQYRDPTPAISSSDDEPEHHQQIESENDSLYAGVESCLYSESYSYFEIPDALECLYSESYPYLEIPDALEFAFKAGVHTDDPRTLAEAMARPDGNKWYQAACDEIQALLDNGTWELATLPPGRKAIGSRWVFVIKRNKDGSIDRYKGRVVAKGYSQRPGFDFKDTFAPTAKWATLRAVLAIAALEDLELESIDISSAFLNGELEEEVYMEQPEGFHQGSDDDVLRLRKGLYGLRQAPRVWHKKLDSVLQELGFAKVRCDHSIWVYQRSDVRVIVPVFVDDITLASKSKEAINHVKEELKKRFKLRDLGPTTFLLGVGIERDRAKRIIHLSQRQYILDILERFGFSDCSPIGTPLDPGMRLTVEDGPSTPEEVAYMKKVPYIHAVGSLMYLAVATRPDIAYAVGVLARFNSNPGPLHWKAVRHVFRYLKGTIDYKLTYGPTESTSDELFTTYSDADHGGDRSSGRSTGAYVVKIGGGAISWSSKLQPIVALSTTEAEYIAAVSAGQEILWLRNLFSELGYDIEGPSTLYIDNQSAVSVAKNPEHHGRIKHLDLRFYWLRDAVEDGEICVKYCPTTQMPADLLTKCLKKVKMKEAREMLGLTP